MSYMTDHRAELLSLGANVVDILTSAIDLGEFVSVEATTIATDEGACDVTITSSGTLASVVIDSGTTHAASYFVTDSLTQLALTGTTGNVSITMTDNLAVALKIRIASGNSFLEFCSTNSAEALLVTNNFGSTPPANQTLTNSATITLPTGINKVVDNGGAVTGIIMTPGIFDGQIVNIINAAAASVTFAASGTSNVADGTSAVIAANRAVQLIYDSGTSLWYRTG